MPEVRNTTEITVTHGPSLRAPFSAVIGDLDLPVASGTRAAEFARCMESWLPADCLSRLHLPQQGDDLPQLALLLAQAFTETRGCMNLPATCGATETRGWIALGYYDALATQYALRFALAALQGVLTGKDSAALKSRANTTLNMQRRRQPNNTTRALMRMARARDIPLYPIAAESQIWQYGQGCKAWHLHTASTHADSTTGVMLQQNKAQSNELVRRLGLPGVEHGLAAQPQQALVLARQLSYPLVVKPLDSGQGYGVTVNIHNAEEVSAAFKKAMRYSRLRQVIIERWVAGDDFRLMVTGGRFQWAIRRSPPEVTGDGASTIAELIARKNAGIAQDLIDNGFGKPVTVDDEVRRTLAAHGWNPEHRLPAGQIARLRSNANVSTGGSFTDVSAATHPDNRAMAETIARAFRLDSVGIDFLTPDIARSWRDVKCAVIEVNATPMLFSDDHAECLLENKFPGGGNGRIPSALVLCDTPASCNRLSGTFAQSSSGTGIAACNSVRLNGLIRPFRNSTDTGAAVQALLLDPACEALIVICTMNDIRQHGLPLDRFDVCAWTEGANPDHALHELLKVSCGKTMQISAGSVADALQTVLLRAHK